MNTYDFDVDDEHCAHCALTFDSDDCTGKVLAMRPDGSEAVVVHNECRADMGYTQLTVPNSSAPLDPEMFVEWVASWVLDGDILDHDIAGPGVYALDMEELEANYEAIVTAARWIQTMWSEAALT